MSQPDRQDPRPADDAPADSGAANGGDALAAAQARAEEAEQQYLRALAELDNVRKRAARDIESAHRYALEKFAAELIGVKDSLELGLAAAGAESPDTLRQGMDATLKLLTRAFEKFGIVTLDPTGAPFDPQWHEAVAMQESAEHPPGTVLTVVQKGYELNGRLLRPARVIVSREPAGSGAGA
jgi:molecular chaperone GrpE